jgi:hypothetical protein
MGRLVDIGLVLRGYVLSAVIVRKNILRAVELRTIPWRVGISWRPGRNHVVGRVDVHTAARRLLRLRHFTHDQLLVIVYSPLC